MKEKNIFRGFKTWLRRQPQNKELNYLDCKRCWLAKFLRSKRVTFDYVSGTSVTVTSVQESIRIPIPEPLSSALAEAEPFTPANILKGL